MRSFFSLSLFALSLFTGATVHGYRRQHDSLARRARGDLQQRSFDSARFTYYDVGLGACGKQNIPSDFIVALNSAQYVGGSPGPNCFKMITITYNGKTTGAQIMDECPGCPYGGLDMSTGLFKFFADESVGVFYGTWWFNDGAGGETPTPTTSPKPATTTTKWTPPAVSVEWYSPSPSSESKASSEPKKEASPTPTPTPSPTPTPAPPSSSSKTSTSVQHVSTIDFSSGPAKGLAVPAGTVEDNEPQNILSMNKAMVGIAGIVLAGHEL